MNLSVASWLSGLAGKAYWPLANSASTFFRMCLVSNVRVVEARGGGYGQATQRRNYYHPQVNFTGLDAVCRDSVSREVLDLTKRRRD